MYTGNMTITEWLRLERASESHLLQPCAQESRTISRSISTTSLANLCQCSIPFTVKKAFPDIQPKPPFPFVPIASSPVTGQHQEELGSILFTPSFCTKWQDLPPSLVQAEESPLSQLLLICKVDQSLSYPCGHSGGSL